MPPLDTEPPHLEGAGADAERPPPTDDTEDRPATFQPALWGKLVPLLLVIAYAIAFVVQNDRQISIDFIFADTKVSLIWEILLLLGIGVLGGVLLSQLYRHHRRREFRQRPRKKRHAVRDLGGRDEAEGKPS